MSVNLRNGYFKEREFYIHNSSSEVVIEIVQVLESNSRYTRFEARHWNLGGTAKPWLISEELATYRIYHGDSKAWHAFDMELWCSLDRQGQSSATN
jgi:hypothetical protein